jgi:hypothetical protein
MKNLLKYIVGVSLVFGMYSCSNTNRETVTEKAVPQKEQTMEMNEDTLYSRITSNIMDAVAAKRAKIDAEALNVLAETQVFLQDVESGKKEEAIEAGQKLIGELDILLTKNPEAALIPIDVQYQIDEVVADIETVRDITKAAKKAIKDKYYQVARELLDGLKSEIVITTYSIPTATYPDAIKTAVLLMQEDKVKEAKIVLQQVFSTIVIGEVAMPLPVLKAQQLVMEAQSIDSTDHKHADKVINLLKNASYQLQLAEEMGYGKKDKEYYALYQSIKDLRKSVERKGDSKKKFKKLLDDMNKFNDRLFPLVP